MRVLPSPERRSGLGLSLLAAVVFVLGACGGATGGGGAGEGVPSSGFDRIHTALCRAAEQVEAGDSAEARATFDDAHVGLHDLVAAAEVEDRAVAADLLEAKQRVEAGLDGPSLRGLVGPVAAAVEAVEGTAPDPCR